MNGDKRHFVFDDNITGFYRMNRGARNLIETPTVFRIAEDFVDRYTNVPVAGLNYRMFCVPNESRPPFVKNTRIYSCLLIENNTPYYWRGRYNEDTDLSLRVLKDGLCTIQFNAFLCDKLTTQVVKGGNTEEFYAEEGTMPKSKMLEEMHPDVAKVAWRFKRWHHYVDYSRFKANRLIRVPNLPNYADVYDYGLKLYDTDSKEYIDKMGEI